MPHLLALPLQLWIQRINAACHENGLNYSRFMNGLVQHNVKLNRKVLSQLAIHEPDSFRVFMRRGVLGQEAWEMAACVCVSQILLVLSRKRENVRVLPYRWSWC